MNRDEAKRRLMGMAKEALVESLLNGLGQMRYDEFFRDVALNELKLRWDRAKRAADAAWEEYRAADPSRKLDIFKRQLKLESKALRLSRRIDAIWDAIIDGEETHRRQVSVAINEQSSALRKKLDEEKSRGEL